MLQSVKQLYGDKLGASDGEIGHVKDFYFDDQDWVIRYLVADTGSWLIGRQVLISPHSLGSIHQIENTLRVNLTRKQIEHSPSIELHLPVSRQYEEEYYRYYGWPCYWQGDGLWGMNSFPVLESPTDPLLNERTRGSGSKSQRADAHLRSTQAVNGYHVRTADRLIGHVCDFMIDAHSWAVGQLAVKTGHRFSGKEELIETKWVTRISYEESTVFVDLPREAAGQAPERHPVSGASIDDLAHPILPL